LDESLCLGWTAGRPVARRRLDVSTELIPGARRRTGHREHHNDTVHRDGGPLFRSTIHDVFDTALATALRSASLLRMATAMSTPCQDNARL
jgi:hypothetical protein